MRERSKSFPLVIVSVVISIGFLVSPPTYAQTDPNTVTISEGIDTFVALVGQGGPNRSHGTQRQWEWDSSDGAAGAPNQGLLWFDIPDDVMDRFLDTSTATLRLRVADGGNGVDVHRITVDWLSGPDGGNNVTWNNMPPRGDGLFPGQNMEFNPSFFTDDLSPGQHEFDVTTDVRVWRDGTPNYGWGFIGSGADGVTVQSLESGSSGPKLILADLRPPPTPSGDFDNDGDLDEDDVNALLLTIAGGLNPPAFDVSQPKDGRVDQSDLNKWVNDLKKTWIGDANLDGEFNTGDLVQIFQRGKFERNATALWGDGDWTGDGRFGTGDLVAAFQAGGFEKGPRPQAAEAAVPEPGCLGLLGMMLVPWVLRGQKTSRPAR